jgi:type II secretory pathway component GspD/PulD (secretin)
MWRAAAAVALVLVTACGGSEEESEIAPCGQVLGEVLVQPLLDVHTEQVQLEVTFVTVRQMHLDSLGITWPNFAPVVSGSTGAMAGAACGPTAVTDTSVTGGVEDATVLVPQGTQGESNLPLVVPSPSSPNDGVLAFTNLGGPGDYTIQASARRQTSIELTGPPVPILPPQPTSAGFSFNYLLTDSAGRQQFLTEVGADTETRIVSAPRLVALDNQTATIFVGTETPPVADLTQAHRDAVANLDASIQFAQAGVTLVVTPRVAASGIVQLTIEPEIRAAVVQPTTTFVLDQTTDVVLQVPIIERRQVKSDVLVQDGVTLIMGGQRDDMTMMTTSGVPSLAKLPVLGTFTHSHNQLDTREVLLLMVTPRIIITEEDQ